MEADIKERRAHPKPTPLPSVNPLCQGQLCPVYVLARADRESTSPAPGGKSRARRRQAAERQSHPRSSGGGEEARRY